MTTLKHSVLISGSQSFAVIIIPRSMPTDTIHNFLNRKVIRDLNEDLRGQDLYFAHESTDGSLSFLGDEGEIQAATDLMKDVDTTRIEWRPCSFVS